MMKSRQSNKGRSSHNRINNQIKNLYVVLINSDGESLGKTRTSDAIRMSEEENLDLVEVSFNEKDNIPICKMLDYGKLKYDKAKNQSKSKKHNNQLKEIKIGLNIADHDLDIKLAHIEKFLSKGLKVKYSLQMRGRQRHNVDNALELFYKSLNKFADSADWDTPKVSSHNISVILNPKKS